MKQITLYVYQSIDGCQASSDKYFDTAVDAGKSSVSCPLKPSDSAPLKHSTMPP